MIWISKGFLVIASLCYIMFGWLGGCGLTPHLSPLTHHDQAVYSRTGEIRLSPNADQNAVLNAMHQRDTDTEQMRIATAYLLEQQKARNSVNLWFMHGFVSLVLGFGWLLVFHAKTQKRLDNDRERIAAGIEYSWIDEQREKLSQGHTS